MYVYMNLHKMCDEDSSPNLLHFALDTPSSSILMSVISRITTAVYGDTAILISQYCW